MTPTVFVHIGGACPSHMLASMRQALRFGSSPVCAISTTDPGMPDVVYARAEELDSPLIREFKSVSFLEKYGMSGFWSHAFMRLLLIQAWMERDGVKNLVHAENDVLLYHDPHSLLSAFTDIFHDKVAITPLGDTYCTAAYMYVDSSAALNRVNESLLEYLSKGEACLAKNFTNDRMVNEMRLLWLLQKEQGQLLGLLPILPFGPFSLGLSRLGMIFDPASWGQYLGGTPQGHKPGTLFDTHWIGKDMSGKNFSVDWTMDSHGKIPRLVIKDSVTPLACLHIHSKRMEGFV